MNGFDEGLLEIEGPPAPPVGKVFDFYVTAVGGMEDVVLQELKGRLKRISGVKIERGRRLSRIFFHYERSPKVLLTLKSVENVFVVLADIGKVTVGQPGLLRIAQHIGQVDLLPAALLHDILFGPKEQAGFQLACTLGKGHRFSASELHQVVHTVLTLKYAVDDILVAQPYRLQLQVQGNRALFGLQLSERSQRERSYRNVRVDRDLPPSAAFCLSQLAHIRRGDVCVDVRCGGGITLIESVGDIKPRLAIGCEAFFDVLAGARNNAQTAGADLKYVCAQTEGLPFVEGSIDKVFCQLIRRHGEPFFSLIDIFAEFQRVLKNGGQVILLAEDRRDVERVLEEVPELQLVKHLPMHVHGRHDVVFILQRQKMGR